MSYEAWDGHDGCFTEEQVEEARQEERTAIVAWMRTHDVVASDGGAWVADAIERGDHLSPAEKEKREP